MKILQYCQHVLGIGHLYRSLEISRAFAGHEVILVTGGPEVPTALPGHVRELRLPPLMMDAEFSGLKSVEQERPIESIKDLRKNRLADIFRMEKPDVFLVELYPFGRKAFRFELDPLLEEIRTARHNRCRVYCSVRDILVEKDDPLKQERRTVSTLNRLFDGIMVHADPTLITLDKTFSLVDEISVPIVYTGFVCPKPAGTTCETRQRLGIAPREKFIVASAGGGKVGGSLLTAVITAVRNMQDEMPIRLQVFTGPFLEQKEYGRLLSGRNERIQIERFTDQFPAFLTAADLSISMAGYNTCMNILAAGVPALVWPFPQNREQGLRADALERHSVLGVLSESDLAVDRLMDRIRRALSQSRSPQTNFRISGAEETRSWIENQFNAHRPDP